MHVENKSKKKRKDTEFLLFLREPEDQYYLANGAYSAGEQ